MATGAAWDPGGDPLPPRILRSKVQIREHLQQCQPRIRPNIHSTHDRKSGVRTHIASFAAVSNSNCCGSELHHGGPACKQGTAVGRAVPCAGQSAPMLPLWRDGEAGGAASDAARHSASPARGVPPSRARAADPLAARSRGRGYTLLRTEGARAQARAREDVGTSPRGWDERERCVRRARGALARSKDDASRAGKRDVPRGRGALPATHQIRGHVARGIQQVRCRTRAEKQGSAARQRRGGPRRQERRARGSRARRP